jgi:hypothetical protein
MVNTLHILADTDIPVKFVIGAIALVIWGIGALANWVNKQNKQQTDERQREQIRRAIEAQRASATAAAAHVQQQQQRARVTPRAVVQRSRAPVHASHAPVHPALQSQRVPVRTAPRAPTAVRPPVRAPAPPPLLLQEELPSVPLQQAAAMAQPASRPKALSAGAEAIAAWMKPATLRKQFILTEVLQPPVALREPKW